MYLLGGKGVNERRDWLNRYPPPPREEILCSTALPEIADFGEELWFNAPLVLGDIRTGNGRW